MCSRLRPGKRSKMPHVIEQIQSARLQSEVFFALILPAATGPFPVLYDLHGLLSREQPYDPSPTPRRYFEQLPFEVLQRVADETGTAIVRVNGGRGWYLDSPRVERSQYQSHVIDEVIPFVESRYPLSARRGVSGHSMGGMGAINFLARFPELFSVGAAHCASLRFMPPADHRGSSIEQLMSDAELRAAFPTHFLRALARAGLRLRLSVGAVDKPRILRENRALHHFLEACDQPHIYIETPGGHEYLPHGLEGLVWAARQLGEKTC